MYFAIELPWPREFPLPDQAKSSLRRANPPPSALRQNHFDIAIRGNADSYFFMNPLAYAAALSVASLLLLTGCAGNDDPFTVHPAGTTTDADAPVPVAGAATPPPESSAEGWKW
jgi:hypothetical protein